MCYWVGWAMMFMVDNIADATTESLNEGSDTVQSSVTWMLGNNIENLTLTGTTAINGTGNSLNNTLTGNSAANILKGGLGNILMSLARAIRLLKMLMKVSTRCKVASHGHWPLMLKT